MSEFVEGRFGVLQQFSRGSKFYDLAIGHDHYSVCIHDGVDPVCDGEDSVLAKFLQDGLLYVAVCLQIYTGCGLINTQHLVTCQKNSSVNMPTLQS